VLERDGSEGVDSGCAFWPLETKNPPLKGDVLVQLANFRVAGTFNDYGPISHLMDIEALRAASPEALAQSPSQMPLNSPIAPPS